MLHAPCEAVLRSENMVIYGDSGMRRGRKWFMALLVVAITGLAACFVLPFCIRPPLNVPKTAAWVRCSEYSYWIAYDLQVKFKAPYEDSMKAAEDILEQRRAEAGAQQPDYIRVQIRDGRYQTSMPGYAARSVADDLMQGTKWWFNPENIMNGVYLGARGPYVPQIWIDKDRGLFYYRETD